MKAIIERNSFNSDFSSFKKFYFFDAINDISSCSHNIINNTRQLLFSHVSPQTNHLEIQLLLVSIDTDKLYRIFVQVANHSKLKCFLITLFYYFIMKCSVQTIKKYSISFSVLFIVTQCLGILLVLQNSKIDG